MQEPTYPWQHDHIFGQDKVKKGEHRTFLVILITAVMMVIEIAAGFLYGSMALLADGLHMGSHAVALGITVFAYFYARQHSKDRRFTFGTAKVNALSGFSSSILLALFAILMIFESMNRFFYPVEIVFNQAIGVAGIGLVVNLISVWILGVSETDFEHHHSHAEKDEASHDHNHDHDHKHHDHNLKAAYLHVLADAMTSVFAIVALLAGKYFHWIWMDPTMGILGAILVSRWALGLIQETTRILLDHQAPEALQRRIYQRLENQEHTRISDLHLWEIGSQLYIATISIITCTPQSPEYYKMRLREEIDLVHITIEVHSCTPEALTHFLIPPESQ